MKRLILISMLAFIYGCGKTEPGKSEGTASSISGYNYTAEGIQEFFVNGAWGGNLGIGSGYGRVCCVMLPDKWTPGLSATVEWVRTDCGDLYGSVHSRCGYETKDWPYKTLKKEIPIEPYERPNSVQVMFLPDDEIKIYVSPFDPQHPEHPGKLGRPHPIGHPEWKP